MHKRSARKKRTERSTVEDHVLSPADTGHTRRRQQFTACGSEGAHELLDAHTPSKFVQGSSLFHNGIDAPGIVMLLLRERCTRLT